MAWRPSASLSALSQRAAIYREIRQFFFERQVLEVDVPVLSPFATTDPFIDSLETSLMGQPHYLQTSPEFFLKRFLAAYREDVYYLGKAFRDGERGRRHSPEFSMLEWYRIGFDEQALMSELVALVRRFLPDVTWQSLSYGELFIEHCGLDPHRASVAQLQACVAQHIEGDFCFSDKNPWLDLLFTHVVEPKLPSGLVGVYDYPASQAALARIETNPQGQSVARRFEVYLHQMELANGYWELQDSQEQQRRFQADIDYRQTQQASSSLPYDHLLVEALADGGLPSCAGVALGVDRLLMHLLDKQDIREVISFA